MSAAFDLDFYGVDRGFLDSIILGRVPLAEQMVASSRALIKPKPRPIVEWARETIRLPSGTGYGVGAFNPLPFQKGIIEAWEEDGLERIYFQKVPRLGSSFISAIGMLYAAFFEGEDTIYFERTKEDLQRFYDDNVDAIIDESPALKALRFEDHQERWMDMRIRNGATLRFRNAAKDSAFKAIKGKRIFADEVDAKAWMSTSADSAGDKLDRAAKRGQQFGDSILYVGASPDALKRSLINKGYAASDKRTFRVPCPHCSHVQDLLPIMQPGDGPGLHYRIDRETQEVATYTDRNGFVVPDIGYECVKCNKWMREYDKHAMNDAGEWVASSPFGTRPGQRRGWAGFHMWSVYSHDPRSTWRHIVDEHRAALFDPSKRRTFQNEWLGLPFDEENVRPVESHWLKTRRCFAYPAPTPPAVAALTTGIDEQEGKRDQAEAARTGKVARSEMSIVGWGAQERSHLIAHIVIPHPPFSPESNSWKMNIMKTWFPLPPGSHVDRLPIAGAANDINGSFIDAAIQFVSSKDAQMVGLVGVTGINEAIGAPARLTVGNKKGTHGHWEYERIGTQSAKRILMRRLLIEGHGRESIVFPKSFGTDYFKSLTAIVKRKVEGAGSTYLEDRPGNEAIDCWVYAYARLLMMHRTRPRIASILKAEHLDREGRWAFDHHGGDMSWQSPAMEEERRVNGSLFTFDNLSVRRIAFPTPQGRQSADKPDPFGAGKPRGPQGAFAPQPARPNPFVHPPNPQGPRPGGGSPYGRVGRR